MAEAYEMHGVWASGKGDTKGKWIKLLEVGADRVELSYLYAGEPPMLTAVEARYLARKLYRLARRIEKRAETAK